MAHIENAILVGLELRSTRSQSASRAEESLDELSVLAQTAGAQVVERFLQFRESAEAATLLGSGKVLELRQAVDLHEADVVIFDVELTPTQLRNLERELNTRVVDRTQLILDIFASRARTREGQLQVELAQLNYLMPRLAGRGTAMSRLGGGIGTRGPGETQLETDRRKIARRIKRIQQDIETVRTGRTIQRRQRQGVPLATVAMAGYTNAGKSTLFNRLTGADVVADARLFATLDPTVRHVILPSRRKVLMSDTVGFIQNLPTTLVKAFRATLEEVVEAKLILHVVDASSAAGAQHTAQVMKVLGEIGAAVTPQILVLNKADLLPDSPDAHAIAARLLAETEEKAPPRAVCVSARTGQGIPELLRMIDDLLPLDPVAACRFRLPVGEGGPLSLLHDSTQVQSVTYVDEFCEVECIAPESIRRRLAQYLITAMPSVQ